MTHKIFGSVLTVLKSAAIIAALFAFAANAQTDAEGDAEVQIEALTGGLTLTGRVLGFDGTYLRLETAQGELTLDYSRVSCTGATCPDPDSFVDLLRFTGTGRLGGLILPAMVEGYARARGLSAVRTDETLLQFRYDLSDSDGQALARLTFRLTTTEDGFADLLAQDADIVMAARPILPEEAELAAEAGLGALSRPSRVRILAFDALVPIVSPGLSADAIGLEDLARAYAGEVTNWADLGGPDLPMALHMGDPGTGLAQGFVQALLDATGRSLSDQVVRHPGDTAVVDAVTGQAGALGITSFEQTGNATVLPLVGACGLRLAADLTSVRTGDYPLTMPLFLYLPVRRLGPVSQDFLDWLSTAEAQLILRRIGVPGQAAVSIPIGQQGDRLAAAIARADPDQGLPALQRLVGEIQTRARLSPTFRFEDGQSALDPASRSYVRGLAQAIRDGRYAGQDLLLIGFSDGRGSATANRRLSAARALTVRREVLTLLGGALPGGVTLETVGLGEVLPIGCDDTAWGRQMNRRVELWGPEGSGR